MNPLAIGGALMAMLLLFSFKSKASNKPATSISQAGIDFIKQLEGLRLTPYKDGNYYSIGYGHNGADVTENMTITEAQAEALLVRDLAVCENAIRNKVKVPLNQNQFDALCSFIYNIGQGNFAKSKTLKSLNLMKYSEAADNFRGWSKPTALAKRRELERTLFLS